MNTNGCKDCSPADDRIRFAFRSPVAKPRALLEIGGPFEEASKGRFDQGAVSSGQSREA